MEKPRLALGSPMAEPYLSQLEALCQITPVSQLCTPGFTGQVHIRLRLCQNHALAFDACFAYKRAVCPPA